MQKTLNEQKPKGLSIFIDMRGSSEIEDKLKIYTEFYNKFRNIESNSLRGELLSNCFLTYKTYVGDAVFLQYKTGELNKEVIFILEQMQVIVEELENSQKKIEYGIGVSYGEYENVEVGTNGINKAAPISISIDSASKSSNIAYKNTDKRFALKQKNKKVSLKGNVELKDYLVRYADIDHQTSGAKVFRFTFL